MSPKRPGRISITGKSFLYTCIFALACAWATATQAQDDSVRGAPATNATDELPLLDAGMAMNLARKWMEEGQPDQAFLLLRRVMQAANFSQVFDNFSPYNMILHYLLKAIGFVETECCQEPLISIPCRYCF